MACSPVGSMSSMNRVLHPVITKVRVWFLVMPDFFRLSFNRLGCSFYREDHVHFLISIRRSNMIHFISIIILIYFNSTIGYINNAQWLALQMAWFAQWIHRCILLIAKVRVWFLVKPKSVQLFFNHLGCSFYCEDFPDFHILLMLLFPRLFKLHKISFS